MNYPSSQSDLPIKFFIITIENLILKDKIPAHLLNQ